MGVCGKLPLQRGLHLFFPSRTMSVSVLLTTLIIQVARRRKVRRLVQPRVFAIRHSRPPAEPSPAPFRVPRLFVCGVAADSVFVD